MSASILYDADRAAHVIEGNADDDRFRLIVPKDFIDDEIGEDADEAKRMQWIDANLPQIISAYTARTDGGWVKAPWNRVLVEEVS